MVLLLVLVPLACGDDDTSGAPPPTTEARPRVDRGLRIRSEERVFAGLSTLVVRPNGTGPWPLVVFVHGAGLGPEAYRPFLEPLAAAGHVVVAPAMPGSVDEAGFAALLTLPFQPGRVHRLIDAVTAGPQAIAVADPEEILVAGHSLGAMTALALAFNSCCDDQRVDAVVALAGRLAALPGGNYQTGSVPVLLVHGDADDVVPYASSLESLLAVGSSSYLLTVEGGDHGGYLSGGGPAFSAVRDATLAFLTATVDDDPRGGLADLTTAGARPGVHLSTRA